MLPSCSGPKGCSVHSGICRSLFSTPENSGTTMSVSSSRVSVNNIGLDAMNYIFCLSTDYFPTIFPSGYWNKNISQNYSNQTYTPIETLSFRTTNSFFQYGTTNCLFIFKLFHFQILTSELRNHVCPEEHSKTHWHSF